MATKTATALDKAREALQKLDGEKQKELTERQQKLDTCENRRAHLSTQIEAAFAAGKDTDYLSAQKALRDIDDEIAYHRRRIDLLTNQKIVTDDVYRGLIANVHKALDEATEKAEAAAAVHMLELVKIAKALNDEIAAGNDIIERWTTCTNVRKATKGLYGNVRYSRMDLPGWTQHSLLNNNTADKVTGGKNKELWAQEPVKTVDWSRGK